MLGVKRMITGRELWQAFWSPFNKKDPAGMHNALKKYWNGEAERQNAGEPPITLAIFDGDPIALAAEHGTRQKAVGSLVWNDEGYAPPDPNHKKKVVNPT